MRGFYLRDTRTNVGSTCMFWVLYSNGYTPNLAKAHVYTLEEAQSHFINRHTDVSFSKVLIDELVTVRAELQYLHDIMAGVVIP